MSRRGLVLFVLELLTWLMTAYLNWPPFTENDTLATTWDWEVVFTSSLSAMGFLGYRTGVCFFLWLGCSSCSSCGGGFDGISLVSRWLHVLGDASRFLGLVRLDFAVWFLWFDLRLFYYIGLAVLLGWASLSLALSLFSSVVMLILNLINVIFLHGQRKKKRIKTTTWLKNLHHLSFTCTRMYLIASRNYKDVVWRYEIISLCYQSSFSMLYMTLLMSFYFLEENFGLYSKLRKILNRTRVLNIFNSLFVIKHI